MNLQLFLIYFLIVSAAFSQSEIMSLPDYSDSLDEIIPKNWTVLSLAEGDLNNDGLKDIVIAIKNNSPKHIELNDGLGRDTLDLNPRILAIYFRTLKDGLQKQIQSNDFIIKSESAVMDDPFDGLEINEKGILLFNFHIWTSAGSWSMSNRTYKFRFQNNAFELIGFDLSEIHRGSGKMTNYSINFITKKMSVADGHISEEHLKTTWKDIDLDQPFTITSMKRPYNHEFYGVYL